MSALDPTLIAAALISALLLSLLLARRRGSHLRKRSKPESLDTIQAWRPHAVRVLTSAEREAFDLVRRAVPAGQLVLAQVPLARFISVPTRHSYSDWLTRVGRLSVDLLVCDSSSRVVLAIDVRAPDESPRSRQRHERMAEVLMAAGVRVVLWRAGALPGLAEVRQQIAEALPDAIGEEPVPVMAGAAGRFALPVVEVVHAAPQDDATQPATPQFEPVSSDYFDDLDALPLRPPARR